MFEIHGYVFRTETDTEVLLHLYAHKGEAMVNDLRGMFAFGLWDPRKTRSCWHEILLALNHLSEFQRQISSTYVGKRVCRVPSISKG